MKPILLYVTAFGPYAGDQIFDFRKLEDHGFFLIHGDTGAGKSTVLDAICYALYGESSGGERKGEQMRSHHAPATRPTSVLFDFAVGTETYRVTRAPAQERQRKVGVGTTREQQTAHLWRRTSCADDKENGEVLAERWEQVNRAITDILTFSSSQFRQVVVLPQGQFRQFLTASSGTREQILSTLFRTQPYREVTDALKIEADTVQRECNGLREQQNGLCSSVGVASIVELTHLYEQRCIAYESSVLQVLRLEAEAQQAAFLFERGVEHDHLLQARDKADQEVAALEAKRDEVAQNQEKLRRARQAAGLADIDRMVTQRAKEYRSAEETLAQRQSAHQLADELLQQADTVLSRERGRDPERQAANDKLFSLKSLREQIDALKDIHIAFADVEQKATSAETAYTSAHDECTRWHLAIHTSEQTAIPLRERAAMHGEARLRATHMASQHTLRSRLVQLEADLAKADQAYNEAKQQVDIYKRRRDDARTICDQLEHTWFTGQAAFLASRLEVGQPCLVCGAVDHPHPAINNSEIPDQQELEAQRIAVKAHEQDYEDALRQLTTHQHAYATTQASYTEIKQQLGESSDLPLETFQMQLKAAQQYERDTSAAIAQLPVIEQKLNAARSQLEQVQAHEQQCAQQKAGTTLQRESLRAVLAARQRDIPTDVQDPTAYEQAVTHAAHAVDALHDTLRLASDHVTQARIATAATEQGVAMQIQIVAQAQQLYAAQREEFDDRMHQANFAREEDYRQALLSSACIDQLDAALCDYEQHYTIATNAQKLATAAVLSVQPPNLTELEASRVTTKDAHQTAYDQQIHLREHISILQHALDQANALADTLAVKEARYAIVGKLAKVAAGDTGNGISFQRFMLGSMLDDVLVNASERLRSMSRERYILERTDENDDKRRAGGLDLQVFDGHTGQSRKAATLSGGESFLAALALALGLADVVQSQAGGIHLDTMFVDEGFGSLDDSTLDLAIETLTKLQESGRLVGIISHVAELRQRIQARLEIIAMPGGSTARFVTVSTS